MSQKIKHLTEENVALICSLIRNVINITEAIKDDVLGTTTTFSSVKINTLLSELEERLEDAIYEIEVSGIEIYDNYSTFPTISSLDMLVYAKSPYTNGTNVYKEGIYFADATTGAYTRLSTADDIDLSGLIEKTSIVTTIDSTVTDSQVPSALGTKTYVDDLFNQIDLTTYYTKTEIDNLFATGGGEADLSQYYTKIETDTAIINALPDMSVYYNKTEIDTKIADIECECDFTNYYTKDEVDGLISTSEVDLSNYYTKTETDTAITDALPDMTTYYTKTEVDDLINNLDSSGGIEIYDNYSAFPSLTGETSDVIVFAKMGYNDGTTDYPFGFYFGDISNSTYTLINIGSNTTTDGNGIKVYSDYSQFPTTISENVIVYASGDYNDGTTNYISGLYYGNSTTNTYTLISTSNNASTSNKCIELYDDYSQFPTDLTEYTIVYAKGIYTDASNNEYDNGFYYYNPSLSTYEYVSSSWSSVTDKPFEVLDTNYFDVDSNGQLTFSSALSTKLATMENAVNDTVKIDDTATTDTTVSWSANKITEELAKKATIADNHSHDNKTELAGIVTDIANGELTYNGSSFMFKNTYDVDNDGIIDIAKEAQSISGVTVTTDEINCLGGVTSNIQSQIDSIVSGVSFKGEFDSFADMSAYFASQSPVKGYLVYILVDETRNNQENVQYIYDGTEWVYGGGRTIVNEADSTTKGIIQLAGDLTGDSSAPQLIEVTTAQNIGYVSSISIDSKGRVTAVTEDSTLAQRLADLEARPRIYVSPTLPDTMKNGDIWIEG